jgi:two-component system, LytTR family, sensor kinase
MMADNAASVRRMPDFLLSWDRLGFRLLVFGGLALTWIVQGRLGGQPWRELVLMELGGLLPWAFLAPMVLSLNRRIRRARPGAGRYLAAHLLGMLLVFLPYWCILRGISFVWRSSLAGWHPAQFSAFMPTTLNLLGGFLNVPFVYFLIVLGAEAMQHAQARQEDEIRTGRLARQLSDARLALLQRQLHPHFLFNALQAISTLLHRNPATADRLLVRLSDLLRAMLDDASGQSLSLRTELELIGKYLDIEQARFGDRLKVEWRVDESLLDCQVPSLIVLPLVENAIRHGLSPKIGPGRLTIAVTSEGPLLVLAVEDDGRGAALPLRAGLGVGSTRERLGALYGEGAALSIDTAPGAGFRARIQIPLHEGRA